MLSIGKLGAGQENYYLSRVASGIEDYYTGAGESPGRWAGQAAERLGLVGLVESDDLRAVLAGVRPGSDERLTGREGAKRVPGWDLTFSAPKSVSVLYGLGQPATTAQVVGAHEAAVTAGIEYLERHAVVSRRRVDGQITQVRGEGLVVAEFAHRTSRSGDPQLHTHCLAANLVVREDGTWGALHSPVVYKHARTAGFVYQAVLRSELAERLGVSWGPLHNGYAEIDGTDQALLRTFSKRRTEIEATMSERGEDSARAAQIATLKTREAKDYSIDAETLSERWAVEAAELGIEVKDVEAVLGRAPVVVTEDHLDDALEVMTSSIGLTEANASFEERDVIRAWCEALPAGTKVSLEALEELTAMALEDHRVVLVVGAGTSERSVVERRWSTVEMLAVEQSVIDRAVQGRGSGVGAVALTVVSEQLARRSDLSDEQRTMVERLVSSGDAVELVVGRAGTGKTFALAAAAKVWRAGGYEPVGVGLAARAAAELETSAGIPSTTAAQLLLDCDRSGSRPLLSERHVVVVDEAAMVDTRRLARLAEHAARAGAKLVLVGDHHQLPAVDAGGAFAGLLRRVGATELVENRRQVEQWERDTLDRLRSSAGRRAELQEVVSSYGEHGRLHLGTTPAEVRASMVLDWYEARRAGAEVAMVALRRADVAELNVRARALLVADGTVEAEGVTIGGRTFAIGDEVVCLENDRRYGVHNALFARVANVGESSVVLAVRSADRQVSVPTSYLADGNLDHAYATTIHKAQGMTVDRTLVLGDDRLYRQGAYTGLSRGRDRNDLYLVEDDDRDRLEEMESHGVVEQDGAMDRLLRALQRDGSKRLALDEAAADNAVPRLGSLHALWAEREPLAAELAAEDPPFDEERLAVLNEAAGRARNQLNAAEARREVLGDVGDRRALRRATQYEEQLRIDWEQLQEERDVLAAQAEDRTAWTRSRMPELERLAALDEALRRGERLAGRAAELGWPVHVLDVLGTPPSGLQARELWREAAGAIVSERARSGVRDVANDASAVGTLDPGVQQDRVEVLVERYRRGHLAESPATLEADL